MSNSRAPKWNKWRAVPSVRLWEGVALSLNIEPSKVRRIVDYIEGENPFDEGDEFNDRLFVLRRNLVSLKVTSLSLSDPHAASVQLRPLAAWMVSIGWKVPPQLHEVGTGQGGAYAVRVNDYSAWLKRELWTLVEAAYLLAGMEPTPADSITDNSKASDYYRDLKDAVSLKKIETHGSRMGSIGHTLVQPSECIGWALRRGFDVPDELKAVAVVADDAPLHPKERATLLKLVIGMAVKGFDYDPSRARSDVSKQIAACTDGLGIGVDEDTVRKWLREGAAFLPTNREKSRR